jgi:DNA-binding transcriptional regulator YdaS (Cro superfamily)
MPKNQQTALEQAVAIAGGQHALASALRPRFPKISQAHIWNWLEAERQTGKPSVPALYCPSIERVTERKVTCEKLCPSADWKYLRLQVAEE